MEDMVCFRARMRIARVLDQVEARLVQPTASLWGLLEALKDWDLRWCCISVYSMLVASRHVKSHRIALRRASTDEVHEFSGETVAPSSCLV
jgi:hypothetical protein